MRERPNIADFLLDQLFINDRTNIAVIRRDYRFNFQATLYFRFTLLRYFWATNTNPDISVGIVVFPQVLPDYCILLYFNEYFRNIYCDISAVFLSGNNISVKNINVFTLKWLLQLTQTISSVYEDYMICNKGIKHCVPTECLMSRLNWEWCHQLIYNGLRETK